VPLTEPCYQEYFCSRNAPLNCDQAQQTVQEFPGAKYCLECGFPAPLPQKAEIRGSRGTYQTTRLLGFRGMGRLYSGIQLGDNQPVVIKEYLLPTRSFNAQETRQRQDTFARVAGVSPADGRTHDFRLISPWEVITDYQGERCYTVTKGNLEASLTLSQYLIEKGAMTATQVRELLYQALQTLQFLHTQKLRLPSGQVQQAMAHGNLSLDSVLILQNEQQYFTIYLCDLALWEGLFKPPSFAQPLIPKPEQDLEALGRVAFYLWVGRSVNYTSRQPLDPRDHQQWPDFDPNLKQFLHHLIGLETPFESAEMARQALLQSKEGQANSLAATVASEQKEKGFRKPLVLLLLGVLALLLVGGGIWYFLKRGSGSQEEDFRAFNLLVPSFSDVNGVVPGEFTYTGERIGTWSSVLKLRLMSDRTLEEILTKPKPDVNAQFIYNPVSSADISIASEPLKELQTGRVQFAITSLVDNLTDELSKKPVAYDGLLVFLPFSKKDENLPKALQGQISLEHLRQIYTGQITNWQQLGGPNLLIKPFAPNEPEAERLFEKLVLKDDPQQIALYEAKVTKQSTEKTQQQIVTEFDEGQAGIISYGILSRTWDQCAGYPLALVDGNKPAIEPLFRLTGQPINFSDNLCDKSNRLDVQTFVAGSYPLGYPLFVVYPKDNRLPPAGRKFAELLTTHQGQCLLSKAGLVPLQPVPEKYLTSHGCESVP